MMLATRTSNCYSQASGRSRTASHVPARLRAIVRPRRGQLQVVSYRTELSESLLKQAHLYAEVTYRAGKVTRSAMAEMLSSLVGPSGVTFHADGVIYTRDRTRDMWQLVDALLRQHAAYEHLVYRPVVSAVDETTGVVFTAVYFELRNSGPLFGAEEPTGRVSKGFLIDKMSFDVNTGYLTSSLVTRQFTLEERDALVADPTAWQPAVVEPGELVAVPDVVAGPADYKYMGEVINKWTGMWTSWTSLDELSLDELSLDELSKVLAPNCRSHDCYGLSNKPNGIMWQGVEQAREVIMKAHNQYDNRNHLEACAVSYDHKLAFHHWRADATARGDLVGQKQPLQGVALVCFNKHLQIRDIYDFYMRDYKLRRYDVGK